MIVLSLVLILFKYTEKTAKAVNVQDTATILHMNGQWSNDYWLTDDDAHYYKIVIPADGFFSFKIMSYIRHDCCYDLYSYDLSEQYWDESVYGGTETSPESTNHWTSLSKGTYILKISSYYAGRYRLQATYKNHHVNDAKAVSYDSPQEFAIGSTVTGALTESDREDWYRIRVPKAGYYTLFCKNYVDHWFYYKIYSSDLLSTVINHNIYDANETEPKTQKHDFVLKAGTYYIKVTGSGYATGKYILTWDSLKQRNCSHSYQEKRVWPTYLSKGYTLHRCEKCGKKYKDYYTPKKMLRKGYISTYSYGGKNKIYLQWYTVSDASGYQIRYCKRKTMNSNVTTKKIKGRLKYKSTIKKLSRNKKYYIQIRAYKKIGAKTVYGKWSSKKCIRTR